MQEVLNMAKDERNIYTIQNDAGKGEVKIADEVVAIIAALAATEVEGVASMAGNITNELISRLGMKNLSKGVKVDVLEGVVTVSLTLNGAAALQRADRIGSIEVGKQGDFIILNSDNYHILPYYIGMNCVIMTIKGGMLYPVA